MYLLDLNPLVQWKVTVDGSVRTTTPSDTGTLKFEINSAGSHSINVLEEGGAIPTPTVAVTGIKTTPTSGVGIAILGFDANDDVGKTTKITATVLPNTATNKNVTWTSSNESVATVNSTGVVTFLSVGSTTIKATTEDGGYTSEIDYLLDPDDHRVNTPISGITPKNKNSSGGTSSFLLLPLLMIGLRRR